VTQKKSSKSVAASKANPARAAAKSVTRGAATKVKLSPLMRSLIEMRKARGIDLDDAAFKRAGFTEATLNRTERGVTQPTLETLERYASAIGFELALRRKGEPETLKLRLPSTRVLTMFNHAGGVGKTSLTRDIGHTLAQLGFRVLLIDLDPQANLTAWLGAPRPIDDTQTVLEVIQGENRDPVLPEPMACHGLDLIPSNLNLSRIDRIPVQGRFRRLGRALRRLEGYDFVLIDPNPALTNLTMIALAAADQLVVPVPANTKGLEAIPGIVEALESIKEETNENLTIGGFIVTQYDSKTNVDRIAIEQIREMVSPIAPVIGPLHHYAIYREAQLEQKPVQIVDPTHKAVDQINRVTAELLAGLQLGEVNA
jgi:chromosome partitioning protein